MNSDLKLWRLKIPQRFLAALEARQSRQRIGSQLAVANCRTGGRGCSSAEASATAGCWPAIGGERPETRPTSLEEGGQCRLSSKPKG